MTEHELYARIQDHFCSGLLMVVGSGISCEAGLPGMSDIAKHLDAILSAASTDPALRKHWEPIGKLLLVGNNLEDSLTQVNIHEDLLETISDQTAAYLMKYELEVLRDVLAGNRILPMQTLLEHYFKANRSWHIVTTNYDRLIEISAEFQGIGVNTQFVGTYIGKHDQRRSADAHREIYYQNKMPAIRPTKYISIHKPHGSLDWFLVDGEPVRSPLLSIGRRLIIIPGSTKYREGYKQMFAAHRESATRAIEKAERLLFLGFGFNDSHLQECFCPGGQIRKPAFVITRDLSSEARCIIDASPDSIAIFRHVGGKGSTVRYGAKDVLDTDKDLWKLDVLCKEVL